MNDQPSQKLPLWYRAWLILPLAVVALYILGMCLTLPPNMIDPRKYPAFMDGGTDWGGSNIFFYTRVVMLLMGTLGFLSIPCLKPQPDWKNLSWRNTARLLLRVFVFHIFCFGLYGIVSVLPDAAGDGGTWIVIFLEMGGWYVLSACFAISLLRRGIHGSVVFMVSAVLSLLFLILGFYLGHWLTGSEFNAHMMGATALTVRALIELLVYSICMMGAIWAIRKIHRRCLVAGR